MNEIMNGFVLPRGPEKRSGAARDPPGGLLIVVVVHGVTLAQQDSSNCNSSAEVGCCFCTLFVVQYISCYYLFTWHVLCWCSEPLEISGRTFFVAR